MKWGNYSLNWARPLKSILGIFDGKNLNFKFHHLSSSNTTFTDKEFDLVYSLNTLHNLHNYDLDKALREMERVSKKNKYLCVESYRTEEEKANLLYWQVTCEAFCTPEEWEWWFKQTGYTGDYSLIYFE